MVLEKNILKGKLISRADVIKLIEDGFDEGWFVSFDLLKMIHLVKTRKEQKKQREMLINAYIKLKEALLKKIKEKK